METAKHQDPGVLRARLEFPIWHRGFVKAYNAWSSAPSDLKTPLLLSGPALAKAESWLLDMPDKLSDSEKRFIVRSIAQRTKGPLAAPGAKRRLRIDWRRSSDRNFWQLYAVIGLGLWFFAPEFIKAGMERALNSPDVWAELHDPKPKVVASAPDFEEPDAARSGAPPEGMAAGTPEPGSETIPPAAVTVTPAPPPVAPEPPQKSRAQRLAELSRERMAAGEARTALLLAIEGVELVRAERGDGDANVGAATAALFRAMATREMLAPLAALPSVATPALFCDGARSVIAIAADGTLAAWPAGIAGGVVKLGQPPRLLQGAAVDRECRRLLITNEDHNAEIWPLAGTRSSIVLTGHEASILAAAFSPDGQTIVTASRDSNARLWDARTGRQRAVLAGHDWHVLAASFSTDGRQVVTASADKTARIWDVATGKPLHVLSDHQGEVTAATFSGDGSRVLTVSWDGFARLWEADSGRLIRRLQLPGGAIAAAQLSRDGKRVATLAGDSAVHLWDAAMGTTIGEVAPPGDNVRSLSFSPDGRWLATLSWGGKVVLHDATSGAVVSTLGNDGENVRVLAFGAGGRTAVAITEDGARLTWPMFATPAEAVAQAKAIAPPCLSADERTMLGLDAEQPAWCNDLRPRGAGLPHL